MSKPTIFFSHSSKDKDMILTIKNKLDKYTGGVLDIFMSSDGQSIPFGTNWVHKVEEGLQQAKIMFVFVTDTSVKSGWIYFEAGFAYSKGIQVIPVGIGVDIGALKAPLNLLQGFNVNSSDSLNNFISIVNKTFDYHFSDSFTETDYSAVMKNTSDAPQNLVSFEDFCKNVDYTIYGKFWIKNESSAIDDLDGFFNQIISYLNENSISYSCNDNGITHTTTNILTHGISIGYSKNTRFKKVGSPGENSRIVFTVSPYNFESNFAIFIRLLELYEKDPIRAITFNLCEHVRCIYADEDISAILLSHSDDYELNAHLSWFTYIPLGLSFHFDFRNRISISYNCTTASSSDILKLINQLFELRILYFV